MNLEHQIILWLEQDSLRMEALKIAQSLKMKDWCISAGFVRNLVWDKLHNYDKPTPLNDLDLIYFDRACANSDFDKAIEDNLKEHSSLPWSVKNQVRMHVRNQDEPYTSTSHAMSHWVEIETAIGARIADNGQIELLAPFGLEALFENTITINQTRLKPTDFKHRIQNKHWLELWPKLRVMNSNAGQRPTDTDYLSKLSSARIHTCKTKED